MSTRPATGPPARTGSEEAVRKAIASAPRPPRASAFQAARAFAWRGLLKIKHVPEQLLDVTVTPVLFTLLFTYQFGGAIAGSTSDYLQYILPGVLTMSVLFTTVYSGVALNTDITRGVVDRFRSLPIWRPAPLVGAVAGDSGRYLVAAAIVIVIGLVLGYSPDGGVLGVLGAVALVVVFSFGLAWVFTTVGLLLRSPNAVLNGGFMVLFPLTFLSSAFVEPQTLPSGLEAFVDANPISFLVNASRSLMDGTSAGGDVLVVLASTAALTAIFAPLTVFLYRSRA